ncbi:hypothetical protein, partial [Pseudolactococcus hodotermopsidis]|uniref:hypothetical protein n=1 Tax=Pseudolactococcus hodotermopsidis TaxID=2709157 RepID=UPI001E333B39
SHFLIDTYRKTMAEKRKWDSLDYIPISNDFELTDKTQTIEENIIYNALYRDIKNFLTAEEMRTFNALKNGEKVDRNKKFRLKQKIIKYIDLYW